MKKFEVVVRRAMDFYYMVVAENAEAAGDFAWKFDLEHADNIVPVEKEIMVFEHDEEAAQKQKEILDSLFERSRR